MRPPMESARDVIVVERYSIPLTHLKTGGIWPPCEFDASFLILAMLECFDTIRIDAHVNTGADN